MFGTVQSGKLTWIMISFLHIRGYSQDNILTVNTPVQMRRVPNCVLHSLTLKTAFLPQAMLQKRKQKNRNKIHTYLSMKQITLTALLFTFKLNF